MKDNGKRQVLIVTLSIISLLLITLGVSYSFFNYARSGSKENVIDTGKITFLYEEVSGIGKGINLTDSFPISDDTGKSQTGLGKVFEFTIKSDTTSKTGIPYEITLRKKENDTTLDNAVKLYLTKVNGQDEEEVVLDYYGNLESIEKNGYNEKLLYRGNVPSNSSNYIQNYKLRMWLAEKDSSNNNIDFSPVEVTKYYCSGTLVVKDSEAYINCSSENLTSTAETEYPYNGKNFTITVNVYGTGRTLTEEQINLEKSVALETISINNGTSLTPIENGNYDFETTVDTDSITLDLETENPNAKVIVEKVNSFTYNNKSNIKRLSTIENTFNLTLGDNYFRITVIPENRTVESKVYKLHVIREISHDATLSGLSIDNCLINETFNSINTEYTCNTVSKTVPTVSFVKSNSNSTVSITGNESILKNEDEIIVEVTAEDNTNKTQYKIVVFDSDSDATLSSLSINDCQLNEIFSSSRITYSCSTNVSNLTPTVSTTNNQAIYLISGNANLSIGSNNTITIVVTAKDGTTTKTYTINATREPSANTTYYQDFGEEGRTADHLNPLSINLPSNSNSSRTYEFHAILPPPGSEAKTFMSFAGSNYVEGILCLNNQYFSSYATYPFFETTFAQISNVKHHFAIVMTSSNTKLYVDGQLLFNGGAAPVYQRTQNHFIIGYNQSYNGENWSGGILYDFAVTQEELSPGSFILE